MIVRSESDGINLTLQLMMASCPVAVGLLIDRCFVEHARLVKSVGVISSNTNKRAALKGKMVSALNDAILKQQDALNHDILYSDPGRGAKLAGFDHVVALSNYHVEGYEDKLSMDLAKLKDKIVTLISRLQRFVSKVYSLSHVEILLDGVAGDNLTKHTLPPKIEAVTFRGNDEHKTQQTGQFHYTIVAINRQPDFASQYGFVHVVPQSDLPYFLSQTWTDIILQNDCVQYALISKATRPLDNITQRVDITDHRDKTTTVFCHVACTKRVLCEYIRFSMYSFAEDFSRYTIREVGDPSGIKSAKSQPKFVKGRDSPAKKLPDKLALVVTFK